MNRGNFQELVGKTVKSVDAAANNNVQLTMSDGTVYHLDAEMHGLVPTIMISNTPLISPCVAALTGDLSATQLQEVLTRITRRHGGTDEELDLAYIASWRKEKGLLPDAGD